MYYKTTLKNNLTLVTHNMSAAYSVSIGVWLKVGSRYENNSIAGISHFLEHLVFKGSKKYDKEEIKRQIEGRGGLLNGFTSEELTCYLAKVPQKAAGSVFDILLDMALNPLLKEEDINKERTVIIEEIKMYHDLPQHMVHDLLDKIMWPGHPLGRNIAGTQESVSSITRKEMSQFKDKYYKPQNMVIVFAGNIKHNDCLKLIKDRLSATEKIKDAYSFDEFNILQKEAKIESQVKEIEQTRLAVGFKAYKRSDPRRFVLTILSVILGGNMSSRLFNEVREKRGLAYEISSQAKFLLDTGAFYINAGLDNKKLDLALNLILKELSKLKDGAVPESELSRAKEFALSQLAMSLEDTLEHMVFLGDMVSTANELMDFNAVKKEIIKIKPKDLKEVARDIFKKDKINISLVGPLAEFDRSKCLSYVDDNLGKI
ncbi:MAG: pitrilysin family protein [Candidatus Omnitrophica bacterium]|nr:pitrilysin family protein [Candidatus Omnitrophota bacterium]